MSEVDWDSRVDNALMNAESYVSMIDAPSCADDAHLLAGAWMALADLWMRRQSNEIDFERYSADRDYEEA